MNIETRVRKLVEEKISDRADLFLVDIKVHQDGQLIILIDGDQDVTIKDCASINRHIKFYLEEDDTDQETYYLEVSSPGLDTPLSSFRQYKKNINRMLSVKLKDKTLCEGELISINDTGITLREKQQKQASAGFIPFDHIQEAKVFISFIK